MADGDDRWIPEVRGEEGKPSLQSINEVVRLIFQYLHTLEGRVGEVSIRDSLRTLKDLTAERKLEFLALSEEPEVSEPGEAALYYDEVDAELKISEDGEAWNALLVPGGPDETWRLTSSVPVALPNNTTTDVTFDTTSFERDVTIGSSDVTIVTAGKYLIGTTIELSWGGAGFPTASLERLIIMLNAATIIGLDQKYVSVGNSTTSLTATAVYDLSVGDVLTVQAYQNHGAAFNINATDYSPVFWGHRLSD